MQSRQAMPASRRLLILFAATTLAPAMGLAWLGWQMVQQDRALESKRFQERREHAADIGAAALQRVLAEVEETLSRAAPANGVAVISFATQGVVARAGTPLPYYPAVPRAAEPPPATFARAEALEFQQANPLKAIGALKTLAQAKDPAVAGGALLRLARNYRKADDLAQALAALRQLSALADTQVDGLPAGLLGRQGAALILEASGRNDELKREAVALDGELGAGRWLLTRAPYALATEQTRRWLGSSAAGERGPLALAEAAESVWHNWRSAPAAERDSRYTLWTNDQPVLVLSRGTADSLVVALAGPQFLQSAWLAHLQPVRAAQQVEFALTDANGRAVLGHPEAPVSKQSVRTASATRLPWTIHAISLPGAPGTSGRSGILIAGLALMAVLVLGGGYFAYRAISRELSVARLQADFVAAVSHEFRTPLTTMRQLSEMLVHDRVSSDQRRRQFYDVLLRESDRLHRLVDGLLNFGRMEAGKIQYRFEPLDPAALVRDVVAEFRQEASKTGYHIELQDTGAVPPVRADRESLARVFWNLLDNAVKYSPDCHTVWVELAAADRQVLVQVRDHGLGIPPEEQKAIFGKFVRGAASHAAAIKGTGVGLAMAQQIVAAHGGSISVRSKPGEGSVFTVTLPSENGNT